MNHSRQPLLLICIVVILLFATVNVYWQGTAWAAPAENIEAKPYQGTELNYEVPTGGYSIVSSIVQILVSLLVIGGLAYLTAKFMKNNLQFRSQGEWIKIYEQQSLGLNKGLFITEVVGKVYILGVTENAITVISEITDRELIEDMQLTFIEKQQLQAIKPGFTQWLAKLMGNKSVTNLTEQETFKTHIQDQVKKLQEITKISGNKENQGDK
ncbi:MAG: flagellar biosynthetic protein FliO [Clostridia bacterium]|nr:flagellar biosynthetic protein FliO [Clostridia bacterium]